MPEFDDKGYLLDFDAWTPELAAQVAAEDEIENLTEDHWRIIGFLREFQSKHGAAPRVRVLCTGNRVFAQGDLRTFSQRSRSREPAAWRVCPGRIHVSDSRNKLEDDFMMLQKFRRAPDPGRRSASPAARPVPRPTTPSSRWPTTISIACSSSIPSGPPIWAITASTTRSAT